MDSPPGCSSSEDDLGLDQTADLVPLSGRFDDPEISEHVEQRVNDERNLEKTPRIHRRRKPRRKKRSSHNLGPGGNLGSKAGNNAEIGSGANGPSTPVSHLPSPRVPITRSEKKAYRSECVKRPKIAAPSNTTSFICDNNDALEPKEGSEEEFEPDGGFSNEYQARLYEEHEGNEERTNHEQNINKRHIYLKQRLDKANSELERLRPLEKEVELLRSRVSELEGEVMKLRSINRAQQRHRTLSSSDALTR